MQRLLLLCVFMVFACGSDCLRSETLPVLPTTWSIGRDGELVVTSKPEKAKVYLDQSYRGETPVTIRSLAPGFHQLVVTKEGYINSEVAIEIKEGESATREIVLLKPGSLEVRSNIRGAEVLLNDVMQQGSVPLTIKNLLPQTYVVKVRSAGYEEFQKSVDLEEGGSEIVDAKLTPGTPSIGTQSQDVKSDPNTQSTSSSDRHSESLFTVYSTPTEAQVTLDQVPKGKTPVTIPGVSIGFHELVLTKTGYLEYAASFEVKDSIPTRRDIVLQRPASIEVRSNVLDAEVYLNGILQEGKVPITIKDLLPQEYEVKVKRSGYREYEKTIKVGDGGFELIDALLVGTAAIPGKGQPDSSSREAKTNESTQAEPQIFAGYLTVNVIPESSEVFLDGKKISVGAMLRKQIAAGSHSIEVRNQFVTSPPIETIEITPQSEVAFEGRLGVFSTKPLLRSLLVPGLGQIVNGSVLRGVLFLGATLGSAGFTYLQVTECTKKTDAYNTTIAAYGKAKTVAEATRLAQDISNRYQELTDAKKMRNMGLYASIAAYALNVMDVLLFDSKVNEIVRLSTNQQVNSHLSQAKVTMEDLHLSMAIAF